MPQPGFYNDNEYRAYPFIYRANTGTGPDVVASAVVDAGLILGLDAFQSDVRNYSIWLARVERTLAGGFNFVFNYAATNAAPAAEELIFHRTNTDDQWVTIFAASIPRGDSPDPVWEGFLVTGPLTALRTLLAVGNVITYTRNTYQLEPGRVQNLHNTYLRSITVANYDRPRVPECDSVAPSSAPAIIVNRANVTGTIKLKEGYNCQITQTDRANELSVTAFKNAGAPIDAGLCAHGSELPLYVGEPLGVDGMETVLVDGVQITRTKQSKFYSGGPACSEVISSVNGITGSGINIVGGAGVAITTDGIKITVARRENAQTNCTTP